jgi:cysteinyl-tRNA synthetase
MSKSKNFLTLRAACPKPDEVRAYRYLVVSSQYRNPLNFTEQATKAALKALQRITKSGTKSQLSFPSNKDVRSGHSDIATTVVPNEMKNFDAALLDDLSMPRAAASLFALIKAAEEVNSRRVTKRWIL